MARIVCLAALALVVLAGAPGAAARVRCSSGVTVVQDRKLRIFGVEDVRRDVHLFACLGRRGAVTGLSDHAQIVTFDGSRYLADLDVSIEGEGGGDATYYVDDLKSGRMATFANAVFPGDEELHPFRITPAGTLVRDDYGVQLIPRGYKGDARLIPPVG